MVSTQTLIASAGIAGAAAFVGYCIYFDKKRRSDPNYKKKVHERRTQTKEKRQSEKSAKDGPEIPVFMNPQEAQAFFLQEVQLGEELLSEGDMEGAVDHFANAITLCGAPTQLLDILRQTLPPQAYTLLTHRLAGARQGATGMPPMMGPSMGGGATISLVEDDLE